MKFKDDCAVMIVVQWLIHPCTCVTYRSKNYEKALSSAEEAKLLHDELANVDWRIANNMESEHFRLLIPIGYQFYADMMRTLRNSVEAKAQLADKLTLENEIEAYKLAVESPPLNISSR